MIIFALLMTFGLTQVKALSYDSTNYIQFKYQPNLGVLSTYRFVADEPFILKPDLNNDNYISCYSYSTGNIINVSYYVNESLWYSGLGSQFFTSLNANNVSDVTGQGQVQFFAKDGSIIYTTVNWTNAQYLENVDTSKLTFYEYLDICPALFDTGIFLTQGSSSINNRRTFVMDYSLTLNGVANNQVLSINKTSPSNPNYALYPYVTTQDFICLYNPNATTLRFQMGSTNYYKNISATFNTRTNLTLSANYGTLSISGEGIQTGSVHDTYLETFYSPAPLVLNGGGRLATSYKIYNMTLYDFSGSVDTVYHDYYPASYVSNVLGTTTTYFGFYDFVTGDFLICPSGSLEYCGQEVETPSIFPTDDSTAYLIMNNIKNSINGVNILPNDISDSSGVTGGINSIFNTIMSTFTNIDDTGEVVFPIPHTGQNIVLKGNYTRTMLTNSGATWLITFITLFWWFIISRYIIKDILRAVTKIQSGQLEQLETTNIKGDML